MKRMISILAIFYFIASPHIAKAEWLYDVDQSAFGGKAVHLLFNVQIYYGVSVRCDSQLKILFLTPEDIDSEETINNINRQWPKLLLRVDDNPPFELTARAFASEGKLFMMAPLDNKFIDELESAQNRVAVAIRMLGTVYHEREFDVLYSTSTAAKLKQACPTAAIPPMGGRYP